MLLAISHKKIIIIKNNFFTNLDAKQTPIAIWKPTTAYDSHTEASSHTQLDWTSRQKAKVSNRIPNGNTNKQGANAWTAGCAHT